MLRVALFVSLGLFAEVKGLAQSWESRADPYRSSYQRPASIPYPASNPYSKDKEELGKMLFFDPRLSGSNWISCASCHNPGFSYGDGLPLAIGEGMKVLGRRTPTVLNLAWSEIFMWDGRFFSLEEQALGPITSEAEMNMSAKNLVPKLQGLAEYQRRFQQVFPKEGISLDTVAKAIANFERSLISGEAPFDRWVAGDKLAISEKAKQGFVLFNEKANCAKCHSGWRFTDDSFHDIGVRTKDLGRAKIIEGVEVLEYAFKTPTLRNAKERAPFLHNGSGTNLDEVIDLYNAGGWEKRPSLSAEIKPLSLTAQEKAAVKEFLLTLSSVDKPIAIPHLPGKE